VTIFDLLFLVLALTLAGAIVTAGIAAVRGRGGGARRIVKRAAIGLAAYFAVVVAVSLASPRRRGRIGEDRCSDDWCIAVTAVKRDSIPGGIRYEVTFRLSSRARGISQRERFVVAYLRDAAGRRYDARPDSTSPPFDVLLAPLQALTTTRAFDLPTDARDVGVVVAREGGGNFPGCCIIGDENSLLHKRSIARLD
jgi:hypothetical protein